MILNLNAQIIWVFVDLLILFVLMKKFLFGPITRMLDDRAQEVSDTLDQADRRLAEAEQQQTAHARSSSPLRKAEAAQYHRGSPQARGSAGIRPPASNGGAKPPCSVWTSRLRVSAVNPSEAQMLQSRRNRRLPLSFC